MIDGVIVYDQWLFVVVSHKISICRISVHFILWALTKHLKFYLSGGFDMRLAGREMTGRI